MKQTPAALKHTNVGNCDIHVKQKISFIYEMKWAEISLKSRVKDQENFS